MSLKPGPKPIAKSTGKPDQRRRDNKNTPGNTPSVKPSKSSKWGWNNFTFNGQPELIVLAFLQYNSTESYIFLLSNLST